MTNEGKAVGEQLLEAWNDRDFDLAETLVSPDFINHNPPPIPGVGPDRDGLLTAMRYIAEAFPTGQADIINLIAEGDKVVVHDVVRGTHEGDFLGTPATGRDVEFEFVHIFRVEDGKIVERWGMADAMTLLGQIGALPQPGTSMREPAFA